MRKRMRIRSIYVRFTLLFLGIWWLMNIVTFGLIINTVAQNQKTNEFFQENINTEQNEKIRKRTGLVFLVTNATGTVLILLAVRSIVRPIKKLSEASKDVAKGNFDVEIESKGVDELGKLTADFNLMVKELKSIDEQRTEFVSNVSHEFRTPMTSIKGFANLLGKDDVTLEQRVEYSQIIVSESDRLIELATNLLKLSEIEHKIIREQSVLFSLDEQIRKTILILEPQWQKKNIQFDLDLEELSYQGEERLLAQVWLNLISNAIKFSNDGGKIEIKAYGTQAFIEVEIKDFGIGIADEEREQIFQQFYKTDASRSVEGNGLGLTIVKKIIAIFEGEIICESVVGEGTIFKIQLKK